VTLTLINQNLHRIVAQASSLTERLQNPLLLPTDTDATQIDQRLAAWCKVVAKGDQAKFLRRLTGAGWTVEMLRPYLGDVEYLPDAALPAWADTLQQLMQTATQWAENDRWVSWQFSSEGTPQPFEPFYAPCLQLANQKLLQVVNASQLQKLSETAQQALQQSLLERLIQVCTATLFHDFSLFRSTGNSMRDFFELQFKGSRSQKKYEAFLGALFQTGFSQLFESYPVLAKLMVNVIEFWVESTAELIHRLDQDWEAFAQQFETTALTQVVAIKASLSDPHNRGRSTCILTFDTGLKIVYKPKDLGTDLAYFNLLRWCNENGIPLPLQCLQVLNRGTYGWIEFAPTQPCDDEAAVQRFYQRSGMLLCLIHSLEGTDCHHENLIACGKQPILIDTETLLTPCMAPTLQLESRETDQAALLSASDIIHQQIAASVMRTMLLPQWDIIQQDGNDLDLSGFGGGYEQVQTQMQWRDINTDVMQLELSETTIEPQGNAPTRNGEPVAPEAYLSDLTWGFEQMYQFLQQHRSQLLSVDSPLGQFVNQTLRYVFRATNTYAVILQQSYHPQYLQSGIDRSIALDVLSRAFLTEKQLPNFWPMLAVETQAMEQCDIPFFTIDASQEDVVLSTGVTIAKLWLQSSCDQVQSRIKGLNSTDLQEQIKIIQGAFNSRFLTAPSLSDSETGRPLSQIATTCDGDLSTNTCLEKAIDIAQQLRDQAIFAPDGTVSWLGFSDRVHREGFLFGDVGVDFLNGGCGIALFLAALAKTTGDQQWQDFALDILQPLRHVLTIEESEILARWAKRHGISGTTGIAGIVYGLSQIAELCQDETLQQDAQKFVQLITPEAAPNTPSYGISRGMAGTILGLLALPTYEPAVKLAIRAGEYLLATQATIPTGGRAWMNENECLTGFYEGTTGIAYALLRLFQVTQDDRFQAAAIAAIVAERQCLLAQPQPVTWAQGAPGIGLARLGSLAIWDTPEIRQDIEIALEQTAQSAVWGLDSLCWGNYGRLELFLVAAQQLERRELHLMAEGAIAYLIERSQRSGNFRLLPQPTQALQLPGLFHGLAGIGYQLLRVQNPQLPSILLWETAQRFVK
jgi:type 2 lantibiotic biosynthesis protein LanM